MMILPMAELLPDENEALLKLLSQLSEKRPRAVMRSNFYNTKKILDRVGFSIPPSMANLDAVLGWPTKAVDGLSGRLHLGGFVLPEQSGIHEDLEEMFLLNRMATEWPQAQTSTFVHGCSFIAVTPGDVEAGEPEVMIQAMPATEATGIWDVRLRRLTSALWLPDADAQLNKTCILFLPKKTVSMTRDNTGPWKIRRIPNGLPRVPVTPLVYRGQLGRPFGMSRLSRAVIYLCQMAARTLLRTEVGSEFYSSPQRYAMGATAEDFIDENGNTISAWDTVLGKTWLIGRDEEGNIPTVGQFPQATMMPHIEVMRLITTLFAGETSLPVGSLGIIHDNPASAAAIDAAWADMVSLAELCQVELGQAAVEVAQNVMMVRDKQAKLPKELIRLKPKWRNAATPTQAAMADATTKLVGVGILPPDSAVTLEGLGYDSTDITRIQADHEKAKTAGERYIAALSTTLNGGIDGPPGNSGIASNKPPAIGGPPKRVAPGVAPARPASPR